MNKLMISAILGLLVIFGGVVQAEERPAVMKLTVFDTNNKISETDMKRRFKARAELFRKLNPHAAMVLLRNGIAGKNTGEYMVHAYYPNLDYFAEATGRLAGNEEWKAMRGASGRAMAGEDVDNYEVLSRVVVPFVRAAAPEAPVEGDHPGVVHVMQFTFEGPETEIVKWFKQRQSIQAKINPEARVSLMKDEIAGSMVNRFRIHSFYPSLSYFAAAQGRERTSKEWQETLAKRDRVQKATVEIFEGLSRVVVGPPAQRGAGAR